MFCEINNSIPSTLPNIANVSGGFEVLYIYIIKCLMSGRVIRDILITHRDIQL